MGDLTALKQVLRSLVVSSPTQMDLRTLLKDYRSMVGSPLPYFKHGYNDPITFLQEQCNDCFVFQGPSSNPVLTLIVTKEIKHIDALVRKQKITSTKKHKAKRISITQPVSRPPETNAIVQSYQVIRSNVPSHSKAVRSPTVNQAKLVPKQEPQVQTVQKSEPSHRTETPQKPTECDRENVFGARPECTKNIVEKFLRKRLPLYSSEQYLEMQESCEDGDSNDMSDSGRQTLTSSLSSGKRTRLEELREEVKCIILSFPEGVPCTDVLRLYREQHSSELNFSKYGYTSIVSFIQHIPSITVSRLGGGWAARGGGLAPPPPRPRARQPISAQPEAPPTDPDDALPGIDFDPDVFPSDCLHFMESIPMVSISDLAPGSMVGVLLGEVYSPSHFWIIRHGDEYNVLLEQLMDDMNDYYNSDEGKQRQLAVGAVRIGHYCCSQYEDDWHRSIIVDVIDSDTVKIRHVDYGTVESVARARLRPLLRRFAAPAGQARRARLAGVRPGAAGRRWPFAASRAFLARVRDTTLVANVVAIDHEDEIMEILLIDTSTSEDISIGTELIRSGHADPRPDSALQTGECYLYPRFEALESGAAPNYAEICDLLRRGLVLDCVDRFRRHVPACLPSYRLDISVTTTPDPPQPACEEETTLEPNSTQEQLSDSKDQLTQLHLTDTTTSNPPTTSSNSLNPHTTTSNSSNTHQNVFKFIAPHVSNKTNNKALIPPRFRNQQEQIRPSPPRFLPPLHTPMPHAYSQMLHPQGFGSPMMSYPANSMQSLPYYPMYSPGPGPFHQMPHMAHPQMQNLPMGHPSMQNPSMGHPSMQNPSMGHPSMQNPSMSHHSMPNPPMAHPAMFSPPLQQTMLSPPIFKPTQRPMFYHETSETYIPPPRSNSSGSSYRSQTSHRSPPPPYNASTDNVNSLNERHIQTPAGNVTLSVSECEIFQLLSQVEPIAAHRYITEAINKAASSREQANSAASVNSTLNINKAASSREQANSAASVNSTLNINKAASSREQANSAASVNSTLNPNAAEFRLVSTETQTEVVIVNDLISFDDSSDDVKPNVSMNSLSPAVRHFLQ